MSKLGLIRSPKHGWYTYKKHEQWHISFYTIVTNYNGPLEAVDCSIHSVRYDMVLEWCWRPSQIGPHQVTYEAVATRIHIQRAWAVANICLYYRNWINGPLEAVDCYIHSVLWYGTNVMLASLPNCKGGYSIAATWSVCTSHLISFHCYPKQNRIPH